MVKVHFATTSFPIQTASDLSGKRRKNVSNNTRTVPSRCFTPPFWTFCLLSLNKCNLCPIGVDLPNIQVFVLPKTGIKLIWRKALCQTSLLYVWKSKMKKKGIYHVKKLSCNLSALFPSIHPTYKS